MISFLGTIVDNDPIEEVRTPEFGVLVRNGVSYTDAEARLINFCREELSLSDFEVKTIVKKKYQTLPDVEGKYLEGIFWELKSQFEDVSPSGKPKKVRETGLVCAETHSEALKVWENNKLPTEELVGLNLTKIEFAID